MDITEGARVWIQTPTGKLAVPGWENGHEASAIRINCEGLTGPGNNWNQTRVKNLRLHHKIPVFDQSHAPGWVTMAKAAAELQVNVAVVRTMVAKNISPARQFGKGAPWMIDPLKLTQAEVHSYVKSARAGKPAPRQENNQTTLPLL